MEGPLLEEFDALVAARGTTRSEALRDLVRGEVTRARVAGGAEAVAALTLVYDHHVRDLTERLTDLQHTLGEKVRATLHVHLDHDNCLEVIVMHGLGNELRDVAARMLATRGVKHGGIEVIATPHASHGSHGGHGQAHGAPEPVRAGPAPAAHAPAPAPAKAPPRARTPRGKTGKTGKTPEAGRRA
jgi:CopG family nickel-responsive transcriptional regulator